ncbi:hypothetical protein Aspvir_007940 [Aspergillus viridinutans]|uniref:CRESS-DNA virus Rep endonuclease domain-containing protein n=1 Tax=Aspergillus viridinutans TaxID=75553 RepID=A0A9P3F6X1_ASPVI|nr:uncharacterized protein Aspvir_007940 [Aspergillus viridinutans]GIK03865.1 hypothetical protein Aspvir_007940 [Aspergillus viridinutans]
MQYLLYQLKEGELKTCHYQGVCQFLDKNTSLKKAKDVLGQRAHCEPMKAKNPLDAVNYCRKEKGRLDGPWEYGELLVRRSNKRKLAKLEEEYDANPEEFKLKNPDLANINLNKTPLDYAEEQTRMWPQGYPGSNVRWDKSFNCLKNSSRPCIA